MDIRKIITDIEGRLTWKVRVNVIPDGDEKITSDPWDRIHYIKVPVKDHRDIEYLHELAHATLAERHHLLATAIFEGEVTIEAYDQLVCPIRCASDWFADALLMEWVPDDEMAEIREHVELFASVRVDKRDDLFVMYGGGLLWAQAIWYLGYDLKDVPDYCRSVALVLLQTDPRIATVDKKRDLINSLATLTSPWRVRVIQSDGYDVWRAWNNTDEEAKAKKERDEKLAKNELLKWITEHGLVLTEHGPVVF